MIVFIIYVNHQGRFWNWNDAFVLLKCDVVQIMAPLLCSEVSSHRYPQKNILVVILLFPLEKHKTSSGCTRDRRGTLDLMSFATHLSYFSPRRLSTLQKHRNVRIDVYSSTDPRKSSPPLDKSC